MGLKIAREMFRVASLCMALLGGYLIYCAFSALPDIGRATTICFGAWLVLPPMFVATHAYLHFDKLAREKEAEG